jgi:GTP cyclohydrolase I
MKKVNINAVARKKRVNGSTNNSGKGLKIVSKNNSKKYRLKRPSSDERLSSPLTVQQLEPLFRKVLENLGYDINSEDMKDTPLRHAKALTELCIPAPFKFTTFNNSIGYKQMIFVENIPYFSLCPHHLLEIKGTAIVAYIPDKKYAGLSKIPRSVTHCSRGMKTQEQITMDIANYMVKKLNPFGVAVYLNGTHSCMSCRGTKMPGVNTRTFDYKGVFDTDFNRRFEFLFHLKTI